MCVLNYIDLGSVDLYIAYKWEEVMYMQREEEKDFDLGSDEPEAPLPLTVTSRVSFIVNCFFEVWGIG